MHEVALHDVSFPSILHETRLRVYISHNQIVILFCGTEFENTVCGLGYQLHTPHHKWVQISDFYLMLAFFERLTILRN